MKTVVLGSISANHTEQRTHVVVEMWEFIAPGIRRRLDSFEITFPGASVDIAIVRPAVHSELLSAGLIETSTQVLTAAEARG